MRKERKEMQKERRKGEKKENKENERNKIPAVRVAYSGILFGEVNKFS